MVEAWVGPDAFRKGVLAYLAAHEWGNATAADLWNALSSAAGKDVGRMMATFLDQPGVPLVTVESIDGRRVRLRQTRFANHGVVAPATTWQIPVGLKYEAGGRVRTQSVLLTSARQDVVLDGAGPVRWVHPNVDEIGYYRWSVPTPVLHAIALGGQQTLGVRERVGFIGNASALLDAGALRGDEYLRLLAPFARDPEPEVVGAMIASLGKVKAAFVTPDVEPAFAGYVRRLLQPALERFGRARRDGEPEAVSLLRPQLLLWLGRDGNDPAVIEHAAAVAQAYMIDPASADPSVAGVALQLRALRGDRALFDEYRRRVETAAIPAERQRFLGGLGYFREPALVDEALRYTVGGKLRPQEVFTIPFGVASSVANDGRTYRFYTENYEVIQKTLPPMFLTFMPRIAAGCSNDRVAAARTFFAAPGRAVPGMDKEMEKVAEAVKDCAALRAREGTAVTAYLRR
jgi:alanyl aminopeptidase